MGTEEKFAEDKMTWLEKAHAEGKRQILLHQLSFKFGELPEDFVGRLTAMMDDAALNAFGEQLLVANSLVEIHFPAEVDNQ